ncbi:sulfotransferase domain-containing protein [Salinibacter altiplanensis]|uniref:sulfotransferase domain-containing protein n=1 Tax=Salinibacter altiplanensis TaxID=1803181 RepID=UPI00131A585E|nr:sulfotransferase domain-containing protein [Salinibacter altiplanensis]
MTKKPSDVVRVWPLISVDRQLYVICMVRDPRDIITSRHGSDPNQYWAGLRFWNLYTEYADSLASHPRFVTVRYEDLVREPDRVQSRLMNEIPFLAKTASFSKYHEAASPSETSENALRGVRPISDSSVGRWRSHLSRVKGQIKIHGDITQDLIKYGYEEDGSWKDVLSDVEPDFSKSHWTEKFSEGEVRKIKRGKYKQSLRLLARKVGVKDFLSEVKSVLSMDAEER